MSTLPMDDIVLVHINLSPRSVVRKSFNLALFLGESNVISIEDRVKEFSSLDDMKAAGFTTEMPECKAASIFFQQSTKPRRLAIGRMGAGEELVDAVEACRAKNREWYMLLTDKQEAADVLALAAFAESAVPSTLFSFVSETKDVPAQIKGLNQRRTLSHVSKQPLLHVAIAGWAMGAQTGLRDSAYTLMGKRLVGIPVDDWTADQVIEYKAVNANYYVNRGATYDLYEDGTMADGVWFDEMINLDKMANDLQLSLMDVITSVRKVAQTEGGIEILRSALIDPLEDAKRAGFIAPGIYTGDPFMGLNTGDMIPAGYIIFNDSLASQSMADRDKRLAPALYIIPKLAGAFHKIVIEVNVNR